MLWQLKNIDSLHIFLEKRRNTEYIYTILKLVYMYMYFFHYFPKLFKW